jgi:hypothetical protein
LCAIRSNALASAWLGSALRPLEDAPLQELGVVFQDPALEPGELPIDLSAEPYEGPQLDQDSPRGFFVAEQHVHRIGTVSGHRMPFRRVPPSGSS